MTAHVNTLSSGRVECNSGAEAAWLRRPCPGDVDPDRNELPMDLPGCHPMALRFATAEVLITRWRRSETPVVVAPATDDNYATLMVAVSATDATIRIDDAIIHEGRLSAGTFQLIAPGRRTSAVYRKPVDFVRLYIPLPVFDELTAGSAYAQADPRSLHDQVIEQLALSIVTATASDHLLHQRFLDGIGAALLARAAAVLATRHGKRPGADGLVPWRLKRVVNFIEANLDAPLLLEDMACAAGLSRMHFAAQFRLATGFRPHTYLTRRRIERAQDLLRHTTMPLVEVALSVGFQTQAHFTTIFRQLAGEPPGQWRHRKAEPAAAVDRSSPPRGKLQWRLFR